MHHPIYLEIIIMVKHLSKEKNGIQVIIIIYGDDIAHMNHLKINEMNLDNDHALSDIIYH
jgi:hypothetical protein